MTPHPVTWETALLASLTLASWWVIAALLRHEWESEKPPSRPEYGSVDPDWWVNRAKKGGGR